MTSTKSASNQKTKNKSKIFYIIFTGILLGLLYPKSVKPKGDMQPHSSGKIWLRNQLKTAPEELPDTVQSGII